MHDLQGHPPPHTANGHTELTASGSGGTLDRPAPLDPPDSSGGVADVGQEALAIRIRQLRAAARRAGNRLPGRPALAAATGATQHQVRKVLDGIAREGATVRLDPGIGDLRLPGRAAPDRQRVALSPTGDRAGRPGATERRRRPSSWPLAIIGLAAAISVWSGWVGLGQLAGFGMIQPLPGVWDDLRINTAVVLPVSVEAYAAYALRCWLAPRAITARARTFARRSAITSLIIGAAAQIAFHLMTAAGLTHAPRPVTVGVATIPVIVLGLAAALANLIGDAQSHGDRSHSDGPGDGTLTVSGGAS